MKKISKMKNKKLFKKMSREQRKYVYDKMRYEHVREDVIERAKDQNVKLTLSAVNKIAYEYVYEGEYECNMSYWDNIDVLMANYNKSVEVEG